MSVARALCLVILDGWGLAPDGPGNAVSLADTPVFDDLWAGFPHTTLTASGGAVGLPSGQMASSSIPPVGCSRIAPTALELLGIPQPPAMTGALAAARAPVK